HLHRPAATLFDMPGAGVLSAGGGREPRRRGARLMPRQNFGSGTPWEALAGYSRAVRLGNTVWVSGTTASDASGAVQGANAAEQARFILSKIESALQSVGASL